ncbi:hypothetical protein RO3G_00589 [Lichtheimia corymbifera JMRC:FSU:9682]|uniref:C2H2-type domain-containing protein n=1 Tax=Lichtheimia corymbifera JMRC:FSU:9682 TaxID=1263082 RepID=A0A068RPY7_9FUNG|nr:hypothetical protein RO3G_00589 [Lichtheimia corymbifera JMRC:FSU:9682]
MQRSDSPLSVKDANGRQISLLNNNNNSNNAIVNNARSRQSMSRRKYHCTAPGCDKSFTTSGHLARHNRIHTGEKNFHCLYPGCPSRFSRQDNMMQHYRTHLSPRSRRNNQLMRSRQRTITPPPHPMAHHQHGSPYEIKRRTPTYENVPAAAAVNGYYYTSPLNSPSEELSTPVLPQLQQPHYHHRCYSTPEGATNNIKLPPLEPSPPALMTSPSSTSSSFLCPTPPLSPPASAKSSILLPPVRSLDRFPLPTSTTTTYHHHHQFVSIVS